MTLRFVLAVAIATGAVLPVSFAVGQTSITATRPVGLEEIVVTARKREESLQDVPISITAFTAEALETRNIESVYDLAKLTPNLSFNQTYGRVFDRPVIRGQSQITGPRTVSFVVDGVYIAGNMSADLDDLEQVEVLKGPQAANYGRAALAGVISYRTRKPTRDWTGQISASYGDDDYAEASGFVSGPITETLSFKLGGRYYDYGGQYTGISSDGQRPTFGGENTQRVSGALYWQPTDDFDVMLRAFAGQNSDDLYNNIIFTDLNCFQNSGPNNRGGAYCGRIPVIPQDGGIEVDFSDIQRQGRPGVEQDTNLYSLESNWSVGPGKLTGLVSWNKQDEDWIVDDYLISTSPSPFFPNGVSQEPSPTMTVQNPGNITRLIQIREYRSQELRFASDNDSPLQWLVGLYHYDDELTGFNGGPRYNTLLFGMANPANTGPVGTLREISQPLSPETVDNQAVFGSVTYALDRWHFALEGRYSRDEITTQNSVQGTTNCPRTLEAEFNSFTPRGSVRLDLNETANIYASIALGTRPGGFNNTLCAANIPAAEFARLSALAPLEVDEEEATNYELGAKLRLLDDRMSLDAAIFFIDWSNQAFNLSEIYTTRTGALSNILLTTNAGSTESKGLELNWRWVLNQNWDLNAGYGYTQAEFKENCDSTYAATIGATVSDPECDSSGTTVFISVAGFNTANAPEHTANVGVQFNAPFGSDLNFFVRSDSSFQSERYAEFYNFASTGTTLRFDGQVGVESDAWKVSLWGRNIGNERSADAVVRFFNPNTATFNRAFQVHYPNGRQYGLTALYRF